MSLGNLILSQDTLERSVLPLATVNRDPGTSGDGDSMLIYLKVQGIGLVNEDKLEEVFKKTSSRCSNEESFSVTKKILATPSLLSWALSDNNQLKILE